MNVFAWIAICAGIAIIVPQLILGMVVFWYPSYVPATWHTFLIYEAANGLVLVYNIYLLRRSTWLHDFACEFFRNGSHVYREYYADRRGGKVFLSIGSFFVIVVVCLARTGPTFQPTETVWNMFLNDSGWVNGVACLTGLVSPNYMYAGIDGAIHLAEECKDAAIVVPRALMSTIFIGFVTSFAFPISMLYCTSDMEAVVTTATG